MDTVIKLTTRQLTMKPHTPIKPAAALSFVFALMALVGLSAGCTKNDSPRPTSTGVAAPNSAGLKIDPWKVALLPHPGSSALDEQIRAAQRAVHSAPVKEAALDKLGWLFVTKARVSFDNGFYKLAEQCAACLESLDTNSTSAMLLRGHVLHNLHRFKEAEPIARTLVAQRGAPMDFGLLADVMMEQGRLDEAVAACQQMMDLHPDSRAYARAAHLRWLKGDLNGALTAMQEAANSVGTRDAESAAWMQTRLAFYQFQSGQNAAAHQSCDTALRLQAGYAPALLLRGRLLLAEGQPALAVETLELAVRLNPLPEYFWALTEALTETGQSERAQLARVMLTRHGPADDPRTYALFLATRNEQPDLAVKLARQELDQRADVFTYDALAWAQLAAGDTSAAQQNISHALAEGTQDARMLLHAAVIHQRTGDAPGAKNFLEKTYALRHLLWPSERKHLENTMTKLGWQPNASLAQIPSNNPSARAR